MTRETKAGEQELVSTNTLHNAARPLLQTHLAAPRHRASMRDLLEVAQAASAGSLFAKSKGAKRGRESCEDELTHKSSRTCGVRFTENTHVRVFDLEESSQGESHDVVVQSRQDDGPALVSQITTDLIIGMTRLQVTGIDSLLELVKVYLPVCLAEQLHRECLLPTEVAFILWGVEAKLAGLCTQLHARKSVGLLPGTLRVSKVMQPALLCLHGIVVAVLGSSSEMRSSDSNGCNNTLPLAPLTCA